MLRLNATAVAVLTALTLTACGGSGAMIDGAASTNSLFVPAKVQPATTATGTTADAPPPKPNSDSDQFTSFAPISDWVNPAAAEELPKAYYTSKIRGGLHTEIEEAYGQRFETTFKYTTTITDGDSSVTGTEYRAREAIPLDQLGNGHRVYTMKETAETHIDGVKYSGDRTSRIQLYQQPNSIVLGRQTLSGSISDGKSPKTLNETPLRIDQLRGKPFTFTSKQEVDKLQAEYDSALSNKQTAEQAYKEAADRATLSNAPGNMAIDPAEAKKAIDDARAALNEANHNFANATNALSEAIDRYNIFASGLEFNYKGEAFNQNSTNANKGKLEYAINFNTLTGHGKITGLDTGTINLNNADMGTVTHTNPDEGISSNGAAVVSQTSMLGIQGVANFADGRADGKYTLGIFGNEAEEVAGFVTEDNVNTVGFGGTRK